MSAAVQVTEVAAGAAPDVDGIVPTALRTDLVISRQNFEGRPFVIVKDPLSLKYFRLPEQDFELAALFDGRRSVAEIRNEFLRRHPHAALAQSKAQLTERIVRFADELILGGFLEATGMGTRKQLEIRRRNVRHVGPLGLFMKALFLKIPLWDPDRLLSRLERRMRWIWSMTGFWLSFAILIAGIVVFALNFGRIAPSLSNFLTLPNLALVWALTIVVKIIHEFGHGLTCKHYGGEVHEMGAMVIVFSPFLYADVTDSYLFPKKRHRILVAAAGIYIELIIAALATLLWAVSQPGPTQQLLFNLMLITSVWTVMFNANPLMKFDGYYIMTDLVAVPNLRAKAQLCASNLFSRLFFGRTEASERVSALMPQRGVFGFVFYSLAAQAYLLYVTLKIAGIFHFLLKPYGLAWLGDWMGAGALLAMLVLPIVSFFKNQFRIQTAGKTGSPWRRPGFTIAGLILSLGLLLLCPWQVKLERPTVLQPVDTTVVRTEVAGHITRIAVRSGEDVKRGQLVATLSSPRLTADVRAAEIRLERAQRELNMMLGADAPAAYKQAQTALAQAETTLKEARRMAGKLELRAADDGMVLTPDLERLVSASLRPGDALCEIARLDPIQLFIPLNERQARHVRVGQRVQLRAAAFPERTFEGSVIAEQRTAPAEELPPNLVATLGGDIAAAPAGAQNKLVPLETIYGTLVALPNPGRSLRPGMTGTVRIHAGKQSLARVLWMKLLDFISFDYRL